MLQFFMFHTNQFIFIREENVTGFPKDSRDYFSIKAVSGNNQEANRIA